MSNDPEKRMQELMAKLSKFNGYCLSPEEADEAYENAPEEPLSKDEVASIIESVTSGELISWEPTPDPKAFDDVSLEGLECDTFQLYRNKGDNDKETEAIESELRKELLDDDEIEQNGMAGPATPS